MRLDLLCWGGGAAEQFGRELCRDRTPMLHRRRRWHRAPMLHALRAGRQRVLQGDRGVRGPLPQAGNTVHDYLLIKILVEYEKGEGSPWFPWLNS